jgi:hypothetical protein
MAIVASFLANVSFLYDRVLFSNQIMLYSLIAKFYIINLINVTQFQLVKKISHDL